jgi:hypothetical protein
VTYDTYFVVGPFILILSMPAIFGAVRRGEAPRVPAIMVLIGGGLIALAITERPDAYSFENLPTVIDTVVTRWVTYFQS